MNHARFALLVIPVVLIGACATRAAVPPWAALERQIESGVVEPAPPADERMLFHAALAHAHPESAVFDPALAVEQFRQLLELHPRGSRYAVVGYLVPLLEELTARELSQAECNADRTAALEQVEELTEKVDRLEDATRSSARDVASYRQMVQRLERDIRARDQRIEELENTLRRLRNIDLRAQE